MTVFLDLACLIPLMLKTNFSLHLKYSVSFIFSQYISFIFVIMLICALFICAIRCFYMYILIDFDCFIQSKHFFNHLKFCKKIKTIITNRLYLNMNFYSIGVRFLRLMSIIIAEWVSAPHDTKSTPIWAIDLSLSLVTLPEHSVSALPPMISTAF